MVEGALNAIVLLVLVFVPALSFLGLFRLIDYVADDELVARVESGEFQSGSPTRRDGPVRMEQSGVVKPEQSEAVRAEQSGALNPEQSGVVRRSNTDGTRCRKCGVDNWDGATYCRNCLQKLS